MAEVSQALKDAYTSAAAAFGAAKIAADAAAQTARDAEVAMRKAESTLRRATAYASLSPERLAIENTKDRAALAAFNAGGAAIQALFAANAGMSMDEFNERVARAKAA